MENIDFEDLDVRQFTFSVGMEGGKERYMRTVHKMLGADVFSIYVSENKYNGDGKFGNNQTSFYKEIGEKEEIKKIKNADTSVFAVDE